MQLIRIPTVLLEGTGMTTCGFETLMCHDLVITHPICSDTSAQRQPRVPYESFLHHNHARGHCTVEVEPLSHAQVSKSG